ncbi:PepSY-associated TM helix domain-containing protein [Dyadobacter aurulentus]|uniref:PepSY-associated TM helix domain-containing protein n=1 Tax=Dyadobacter sp. UC 10 TaxID=2605428 RepID=UPI0011F2D6D4|nr:PepSY-associated TM helix domain-containing protein [Dyadobacter sp. UC 10]KAA0991002.1 PepSY domain-containing protein [Dyadobacter sp. UC 10]
MKKAFKKIASQLHLWLGIISGLVVFIVALTGCILVFEDELEPVLYPEFHIVEANAGERILPLDHLESIIKYKFPKNAINRITIEPERDRTIVFNLKEKENKDGISAAIDPYTGCITGVRNEHEAFFTVVLHLHRYLCLEETGKVITGISCVMFLVIMITGLILWWPNRKNRKQRFRIKWDAKFKRLNWDLHAVFGFYVLPFVFIIAATGLVWSYKWVNNLIYLTFDGKPQVIREAPANVSVSGIQNGLLEKALTETNNILPNPGRILFTMPKSDSLSITVSKADDHAAVSNIVSFLYFDKNSGNLISKRLYDNETRGMKVRRLVYPIHTGNIFGWPTKIIAFIVALIAASLPVTGVVIWLGKKGKGKKKLGKMKVAGDVGTSTVKRRVVV